VHLPIHPVFHDIHSQIMQKLCQTGQIVAM